MAVATYSEYATLYPAGVGVSDFDKLLPAATALLAAFSCQRAHAAVGLCAKRVTLATCALVNELHMQQLARGNGGAQLASVSNDGYSESYVVTAHTQEAEQRSLRSIAQLWLSGTGLMSAR